MQRRVSAWPSTRAQRVLAALLRLGWRVKRQSGSHKVLTRDGWSDFVFAFHDGGETGPSMLARIARHTGLTPRRPTSEDHRAAELHGFRGHVWFG